MNATKINDILLSYLVQNYYERYATFEGIETTILQNELKNKLRDNEKIDVLCYRLLGYKAITFKLLDGTKLSMNEAEVAQFRTALLYNKISEYFHLFHVQSEQELMEILEDFHFLTLPYVSHKTKCDSDIEEYLKLVEDYYRNCPTNYTVLDGAILPFKEALKQLLLTNKKISSVLDVIANDSIMPNNLVKFKTSKGAIPSVAAGVLVTPVKLSAEQKERINRLAITNLLSGEYSVAVNKLGSKAPIISLQSQEKYLALLDLLRGKSSTFAQFARQFDFVIHDQIAIYRKYGMAITIWGNLVIVVSEYATEDVPYFTTTISDFQKDCQRREKQAEAVLLSELTKKQSKTI